MMFKDCSRIAIGVTGQSEYFETYLQYVLEAEGVFEHLRKVGKEKKGTASDIKLYRSPYGNQVIEIPSLPKYIGNAIRGVYLSDIMVYFYDFKQLT